MQKNRDNGGSTRLHLLTGLSPEDLGDVLDQNPRAYMALKGAVAEKHLENILKRAVQDGVIRSFRKGTGDFEKDFYCYSMSDGQEIAVECKNVQVQIINSLSDKRAFLSFLREFNLTSVSIPSDGVLGVSSGAVVQELIKKLPSHVQQSGIARYKFSAETCGVAELSFQHTPTLDYLGRFKTHPISIDFQRTRNSRQGSGVDSKQNRFYRADEIDVVAACLFSRTLSWDFIFTSSSNLPRHPSYPDRYYNSLKVDPKDWHKDLGICLKEDVER